MGLTYLADIFFLNNNISLSIQGPAVIVWVLPLWKKRMRADSYINSQFWKTCFCRLKSKGPKLTNVFEER